MSTFDEREKGFERKFANDQELEFIAMARRNRLLGEWAAELMGLENVHDYAQAVVKSDIEQPGLDSTYASARQRSTVRSVPDKAFSMRAATTDACLSNASASVCTPTWKRCDKRFITTV